jgi:hypothetical protein
MLMLGPTNPFGGTMLGIAPLDCGNYNPNDVGFAFEVGFANASLQGSTVSHEAGHTFGLDHVQGGSGELMAPSAGAGELGFTDECLQTVQGSCPHENGCQNAYQELMAVLGPAQPDVGPPSVTITAPVDGDTFDVGADFSIVVDATDDVGVELLRLFVNGSEEATDGDEPWGWEITDIPEGTYELHVIGNDHAGNETASNVVTIEVGTDLDDGSDDGGTEDDDGGSGGDSDGDDGAGPGPLPPGAGGLEVDRDVGCGCTSPATAPPWLLALFGFGLCRRRSC